jgi:hypothetical protein
MSQRLPLIAGIVAIGASLSIGVGMAWTPDAEGGSK